MKTKLLYVLTSTPKDIYLEQLYISMYSAKYYMPDSHIVLLTDTKTKETFVGYRAIEVQYADEIIVIDLDDKKYNAQQRSRQLKTTARNHVKGDYIYIDCDTIIVKPFYEIDDLKDDIAACIDTHSEFSRNPYRRMCVEDGKALGWPISEEKEYFNSGVIYVKDNEITRNFYKQWNRCLNEGYDKKVFMDQPSFAKANYELGHPIKRLEDYFNCELKHGIKFLKDAYIVHYLCTNPSKFQDEQLFVLNEKSILEGIKIEAKIPQIILDTIKDPFCGLASVTHCFAGNDVHFFSTRTFRLSRAIYNHRIIFLIIESCITAIVKIVHFFQNIKNR